MAALPEFPDNCTGCSACGAVCPVDAIVLTADAEGFLYPQVDREICTSCGLCLKICPVLHPPAVGEKEPCTYAALSQDETSRQASSSGGVFAVLARHVLAKGGKIAGAAWADDFVLRHCLVDREEDLTALLGSKYIQSHPGAVLREVQTARQQGLPVLFAGTPCQTAGLQSFLREETGDGLWCVDLVCHGVPSPLAWAFYVRELETRHGAPITHASFRAKTAGWRQFSIRVEFKNGQVYEMSHRQDPYMWLFLKNMNLRRSCYQCPFKGWTRASDLTLADFWGVESLTPALDDDRGTSLVLVHSNAGAVLLESCSAQLKLESVEVRAALHENPLAFRSVERPAGREQFFSLLGKRKTKDMIQILLQAKSGIQPGSLSRLKQLLNRR